MCPPPETDVSALRDELELLAHDSSLTDKELAAFLDMKPNVADAAKAVISAAAWKEENPVTIADVAPFLRAAPRYSYPSGCIVCLEDMKGGVARDSQGRPILLMYGLPHGSELEMKKSLVYAVERAAVHCQYESGHIPGEVCIVVEVMSRERMQYFAPTFRFPDANTRKLLDFMRRNLPSSQKSVTHFCGVPSFVVAMFALCRPFMSSELFEKLNVKSSFKHLKKDGHIPTQSLLPYWEKEGTFDFDFDKYVEWRCREEGIDVNEVSGKGEGRKYTSTSRPDEINISTKDLLGEKESKENCLKYGAAQKRGSGTGLFSTTRWKTKFLVVQPGVLCYFESDKISSSNIASRVIPLDPEMSTVEKVNMEGAVASVLLTCSSREFIFGFDSEKEADEWTQVLQTQCKAPAPAKSE